MKTMKKTLALLLAIVLVVGAAPMTAMALWSGGGEGNYTTAYLDLTDFPASEGYGGAVYYEVPVSYIASHLTDRMGNAIALDGEIVGYAWGRDSDAFYRMYDTLYLNYDFDSIKLIVGTFDQLDRNNEFILVKITYPADGEGQNTKQNLYSSLVGKTLDKDGNTISSDSYGFTYYLTAPPNMDENQPVRIAFSLNTGSFRSTDNYLEDGTALHNTGIRRSDNARFVVTAVLGRYATLEEIPEKAENITDQLFSDNGYLKSDRNTLDVTFLFNILPTADQDYDTEETEGADAEPIVQVEPARIYIDEASIMINSKPDLHYNDGSSWVSENVKESRSGYDENYLRYTMIILSEDSPLNRDYRLHYNCYDWDGRSNKDIIKKAVVGTYASLEEAAGQKDIQDQLFWASKPENSFPWNFAEQGSLSITVFDVYGKITQITQVNIMQTEKSKDVSFRAYNAYDPVYSVEADTYVMSPDDDAYYDYGYQTLFILNEQDGSAIKGEELIPYFDAAKGAKVYAGLEDGTTVPQQSGESIVPVTYGKPIHYSVAAENETDRQEYYLTFVTQTEGGALFVNGGTNSMHIDEETGLPVRIVKLKASDGYDSWNDDPAYYHDILFANFGTEELTGLKVELEHDWTLELDDYWTISEDSVGTLPPFKPGNPVNYGKIRLVGTGEFDGLDVFYIIDGRLTISADGVEPVTILLTGTVGKPEITTTAMKSGAVKYVPYSTFIQTNYIGDETDVISFSVVKGSLPKGVTLKPNGEVYGVPLETGTFTFTVQASYKDDPEYTDTQPYTLVVAENTDENVENATDIGYELIDRIPNVIVPSDQLFHSKGELSEFIAVYLDGRELIQNVEYLLEEGSTKITILEETFGDEEEGDHTVAAEFRVDGDEDNEMKRSAQNFKLEHDEEEPDDPSVNPPKPPVVPSVPSHDESAPTPDPEPEKPAKEFKFADVPTSAWFYEDVKWVFDRDLMVGVSENRFEPDAPVDAATIVMVLARTIGVDLTQFADSAELNLPQDQWYSAAANWAVQSGLIDDGFEWNKPYSRGQMAVLLFKYFKFIGIDCSQPVPTVEFADADEMTLEQNEAYQVLYKYGIFKGVGNNRMDVHGNTSRAQLAALMHRIKEFIDSKI